MCSGGKPVTGKTADTASRQSEVLIHLLLFYSTLLQEKRTRLLNEKISPYQQSVGKLVFSRLFVCSSSVSRQLQQTSLCYQHDTSWTVSHSSAALLSLSLSPPLRCVSVSRCALARASVTIVWRARTVTYAAAEAVTFARHTQIHYSRVE